MKMFLAVSSFLCAALLTVGFSQSRGWHGIVPLHSTRADVERLMGLSTEKLSQHSDLYKTPKETVIVQYSRGLPCGTGEKYSQWRVPRNTVESILVTPTQPVRLSDLGIDESKYDKRQGGHRSEDVYYINEQTGESLRVFLNEVREMSYFPGTLDVALMCPGLAKPIDVKCKGLTPPKFDFYQDVSLEREKSLLDNFVIALNDEPDRRGYIIAYAGKRARVGEGINRAKRAKEYLVRIRKFPANRLKAIDGGYREQAQVDLYVVPGGVCPPSPDPAVDPRDVRIIRTGKPGKNRR